MVTAGPRWVNPTGIHSYAIEVSQGQLYPPTQRRTPVTHHSGKSKPPISAHMRYLLSECSVEEGGHLSSGDGLVGAVFVCSGLNVTEGGAMAWGDWP